MAPIDGTCDPHFAAVRDAFAANFDAGREVGASFAASVDGRVVVDVWGGHADAARTRPWQHDTIVNVFSTTKAMTTTCAHLLVERGLLDVDAPVARWWPEFAAAGKENLPVRYLLSHQAGLAALRTPLPVEALYDWPRLTTALAGESPWWEPGTASGYHAITFGYLVGEVVRRITGRTLGAFFRDEMAGPLDADFHIGLAPSTDTRVAEMIAPSTTGLSAGGPAATPDPESLMAKVLGNPRVTPSVANQPAWRRAEIPAANGHGNARSVMRVMTALACGKLLHPDTLARATEEQWLGKDIVLGFKMRWGLGFMLSHDAMPLGGPRAFGHGGWGGSLGIADPDARVAWSYVMNKMSPGTTGDSRAAGPLAALYAAL